MKQTAWGCRIGCLWTLHPTYLDGAQSLIGYGNRKPHWSVSNQVAKTALLQPLRTLPSISTLITHALTFYSHVSSSCVFNSSCAVSSFGVCTAASLAEEVIRGKIDVLAGCVTALLTAPNQKLRNVLMHWSSGAQKLPRSNKVSNE